MARAPSTFRQADVTRALRAAQKAGVEISRVEISRDGKIVIVTAAHPAVQDDLTPLDTWMASHGSRET